MSSVRAYLPNPTIAKKVEGRAIDASKVPPFTRENFTNSKEFGIQTVSYPFGGTDKIYFNIEKQGSTTNPYEFARYTMQFNQAIVKNPKDYYVAISKFSLPSLFIPVFLPDLSPSFNGDSNKDTIYSVTLTKGGINYKEIVQYEPENGYPFGNEFYGYIYDFTYFCSLVNQALALATQEMNFANPGLSASPPYLQYDSTTRLLSLVCTVDNFDNDSGSVAIYVNYPLSVLLSGINMIQAPINGIIPDINGKDAQIIISKQYNNWYNPLNVTPSTPPLYYIFTQQYPALEAFSPIASIRITSNTLPISKENILSDNSQNVVSASPVLQTFYPIYSVDDIRPFNIIYVASTYHLINMFGDLDIDKLDIQFEWIDLQGRTHPVYLSYNSVMLVELTFMKKSTFTS